MSDLIVPPNGNPIQFLFEGQPIRIAFTGDNEPVFIAADVCRAVDITNVSQALARLDEDEKTDIILNDVTGRPQKQWCVTESGLYTLILSSRKSETKAFKRWITHDVLPQIRKTGSYIVPDLSPIQVLKQMFSVIENHDVRLDDLDVRLATVETHIQPQIEYFTIMGYCHNHNITISLNDAQSYGQRASRLSRSRNVNMGRTADPRFGEVNTYHISILDEIFGWPET